MGEVRGGGGGRVDLSPDSSAPMGFFRADVGAQRRAGGRSPRSPRAPVASPPRHRVART
jgi:hypothetical protein